MRSADVLASGGTRVRRSPRVLWRDVGDEAVLAPLGREDFELLSASAAAVWRLLEEPRSWSEIVRELGSAPGADGGRPAGDVRELLARLLERGLVEVVADGGA